MTRVDGERGMFRGSELPKLILLAGVLIVGWALVAYFVGNAVREAPKPALIPAVNVPILPPPDPTPEIAGVIDDRKREARDQGGLAILLDRVRNYGEDLAKNSRREVTPADLMLNPRRYRGLPIRLQGFARQVSVQDGEDPELVPKGRLYEIWFQSEDHFQRKCYCCLITEDVPPTLPSGRDLKARIIFEGYFLKLLAYPAADTARHAPMLIGRITHLPNAPEPTPPWTAFTEWLWTHRWRVVPIAALAYISMRVAFQVLGKRRRTPIRSFLTSADTIEPVDLDRWVDDAALGDEKGDTTKP